MNMIPFHHVYKPNYLVIQFKLYKNVLMLENYCSDPDCDCNEVILNFAQLNEENKIKNTLLNLKVDLENGDILEQSLIDEEVNAESVINEFQQHFYQFKDHLKENNEKVKKYFSKYQGERLPDEIIKLVEGNNCVDYQKLFGDLNQMTINYQDEGYLIKDQYCMNPTCTCDEVIIVVYRQDAHTSDFVFRVDLNSNKYDILKLNNNEDHKDLIEYIIEHKKTTLKSRYDRMKEVGKQFSL